MKKIDFEAHFYTRDYLKALNDSTGYPRLVEGDATRSRRLWYFEDVGQPFADFLYNDLLEVGEKRIQKMDENGIDMQILSLSAPGVEQLAPEAGTALAKAANDELAQVAQAYPGRLLGYAALAPKAEQAAADELDRAVSELGLVGWNTHSNFGDFYIDHERFWPIMERAAKLKVPVYLHPTVPAIEQIRGYGFALAGAPFGFGVETAMTMMRLIYSGVFDKLPDLKVILGHLGEALPFLLKRIDWAYVRPFDPAARPHLERKPSEYLKDNVFVTTSGNYYGPAFMCTRVALGIDRILLGTDYPYEDTKECLDFIDELDIPAAEKEKIYYGNAAQLGFTV